MVTALEEFQTRNQREQMKSKQDSSVKFAAEKTRLESEKERIELEKSHVARDQTHLQEEIEQTEGRVPKFHSSKWKFRGHFFNLSTIK